MREIKFRAWPDGETKEMMFVGDSYGTTHPLDCCKYALEGQPVKLMQFTGVQDFFGNDIFDGDIVFLDSKMMIGVVESDGPSWRIKFEKDFDWLCDYFEDLHVIGNIHENPELLN